MTHWELVGMIIVHLSPSVKDVGQHTFVSSLLNGYLGEDNQVVFSSK